MGESRSREQQHGPLSDVRIIDLSRLVAGNMVTHVLADLGADVIKVEHPERGDDLRGWRVKDVEIFWKVYCRNKRSIGLDLKSPAGLDVLVRLVRTADALVENFVPGTLERMGLAPERLREINPKLVVVRLSGWGQTGPYRDRPGFGTLVEGMSGYADLNGFPESPPCLPPLAMADMVAGLYAAVGLLTALRDVEVHRGLGQDVDISLFEPIFSLISTEAAQFRLTNASMRRNGNQSTHTAPRNLYVCADGKYVALSGSMQSMAERLFRTIGRPELIDDARFDTNASRLENRDELDRIIGDFIRKRSRAENLALFEAADVTVGPVCSVAELLDHPYTRGRRVIVELEDGDGALGLTDRQQAFAMVLERRRENVAAVLALLGERRCLGEELVALCVVSEREGNARAVA